MTTPLEKTVDPDKNTAVWNREIEDVKSYLMGFVHGSMNRLEDDFTSMLRDVEMKFKTEFEDQKDCYYYNYDRFTEQIDELRERIKILEQKSQTSS